MGPTDISAIANAEKKDGGTEQSKTGVSHKGRHVDIFCPPWYIMWQVNLGQVPASHATLV